MRLLLLCFAFMATLAQAQSFPDPVRPTITDHADLLSLEDEAILDQILNDMRSETGVQTAVVTLNSKATYAPDATLETFATDLFNTWGIGDADRNDGILLLVLSEDREVRIELGEAYGRDWDRVASTVLNQTILPAFEAENYRTGLFDGIDHIHTSIARPFVAGETAPDPAQSPLDWMVIVAFAGAALFVGRRRLAKAAVRLRRCPNCGRRSLSVKTEVHVKPTASTEGEGEHITVCSSCAYRDGRRYKIRAYDARKTTNARGGGFGGGRSGGGGASGRW